MNADLPLRTARGSRFMGAPEWRLGSRADVIVLGCATDLGMHPGGRSAAGGPRALRQASQVYALGPGDPFPGWYEYASGRTLLPGVSILDAGDLEVDALEPRASLSQLPTVLGILQDHCRLVLLLGGDHSLTYWTSESYARLCPALLVMDAHEDATRMEGPYPHAGNFIRYLDDSPNVATIIQYGLRGMVPADRVLPPPNRIFARNPAEVTAQLLKSKASRLIVSLDVDVLDPVYVRAVASPSPNGLSPDNVIAGMAAAAASGLEACLLEVMEFAPETREDPVQAFLVVQLIIRAVHELLRVP